MTSKTLRRWFRFRLRTLLAFTLMVGALMGWVVRERRLSQHEQYIARQLQPQGLIVSSIGHPLWLLVPNLNQSRGWRRELAGQVLGERVLYAWASNPDFNNVSSLVEFKDLKGLDLHDTSVKDVAPLAKLNKLQELDLNLTQVNDLTPLTGLTNLQRLDLHRTHVSDLVVLAGLKKLTSLDVRDTLVTQEQVEVLQKTLPKCAIEHDPF